MIEWTFLSYMLHALLLLTGVDFIRQRVVVLFFPTMTKHAVLDVPTAFTVPSNVPSRLPVFALRVMIMIDLGLPPEILPVMGIHSVCLVMVLAKWSPFGFEIIHVEIEVSGVLMDQINFDL